MNKPGSHSYFFAILLPEYCHRPELQTCHFSVCKITLCINLLKRLARQKALLSKYEASKTGLRNNN